MNKIDIFASKSLAMNPIKSTNCKYLAHVIFCSAFLFLFSKNALLRPSPASAQNKDFFIGAMLLFFCYLHALVLHPALYRKNKTLAYVACSIISIIVCLVVEFSWLYTDIMDCLLNNLSVPQAHAYYRTCILFASLRDAGLLSFSFLVCEFNWNRRKEESTERLLMESAKKIMVKNFSGKDILLNFNQIRYCEQEENTTKIYGMDGNVYFRYGSLKHFQNLFDNGYFVQINRKTLIAKNHIKSFTNTQLWIVNEEEPFEISSVFQKQMESLFISHKKTHPLEKESKRKKEKGDSMDNKNTQSVYQIIIENPFISAVKLADQTRLSQSTINRILKQLKDEGLVEYVGSKKTGGYNVCQR